MTRDISAYIATWNVNGKLCKDDLSAWLTPSDQSVRPDLYVLGFQEFDLTKESFVQNDPKRLQDWEDKIERTLSTFGTYEKVASSHLVGMLIIVYATPEIRSQIVELDTAMVGCGYVGIMGNKGAVAVRFLIGSTSICFVNTHLNAHVHNVRRRQEDFESICSRMVFFSDEPVDVGLDHYPEILNTVAAENEDEGSDASRAAFEAENKFDTSMDGVTVSAPQASTDGRTRVLDHDIIVWFGDLNYRIELPRDTIFEAIEKRDWEALSAADQLRREMAAGRVFQGFIEAPTHFLPSYKFNSGTDTYDSSPKQRLPAYCDRVIWRARDRNAVRNEYYQSFMPLRASDHKPVAALLTIATTPAAPNRAVAHRTATKAKRGYLSGMALQFARKWSKVAMIGTAIAVIAAYAYWNSNARQA